MPTGMATAGLLSADIVLTYSWADLYLRETPSGRSSAVAGRLVLMMPMASRGCGYGRPFPLTYQERMRPCIPLA